MLTKEEIEDVIQIVEKTKEKGGSWKEGFLFALKMVLEDDA